MNPNIASVQTNAVGKKQVIKSLEIVIDVSNRLKLVKMIVFFSFGSSPFAIRL